MATLVTDSRQQLASHTSLPSWIWWSAAALGFSLFHIFIDFHVGFFGKTTFRYPRARP